MRLTLVGRIFYLSLPLYAIRRGNMRKFLLTFILATITVFTYAQPRSSGIRIGASGFELDYLYSFQKNQFLEGGFGIDFGYNANGQYGIKAAATYNFIWARPAWTEKGSWILYAGPGATMGYVNDDVHFMADDGVNLAIRFQNNGFMLGLCAQVGVEYSFWFPLQLALDLRPVIGMHVNKGYSYADTFKYPPKVGFYDNGLMGFIPSLSIRYRF